MAKIYNGTPHPIKIIDEAKKLVAEYAAKEHARLGHIISIIKKLVEEEEVHLNVSKKCKNAFGGMSFFDIVKMKTIDEVVDILGHLQYGASMCELFYDGKDAAFDEDTFINKLEEHYAGVAAKKQAEKDANKEQRKEAQKEAARLKHEKNLEYRATHGNKKN